MSKTRIDWATDVINCISGCSNCDENGFCQGKFKCYAEGFARRLAGKERNHPGSTGYPIESGQHFKPCFHPDKFLDIANLPEKGKPKRIFLDSMSDWFCEGVEPEWVHRTIDVLWQVPRHHFLVLTKRPERIMDVLHCQDLPPNLWLGVSVTCQEDVWRIEQLQKLRRNTNLCHNHLFVSFEPLHGPISCNLSGIEWAIIGAESGNRKEKIEPQADWVNDLMENAEERGIHIFLKDNLAPYLFPAFDMPQEFPGAMQ